MNREIKFRGKRCDTGEWVYGFYGTKMSALTGKDDAFIIQPTYNPTADTSYFTDILVIDGTVGEYTGLKDKNGVEIYSGDKLEDGDEGFFVVRYCEKTARFVLDLYGAKGELAESGFDETAGEFGVVDTLGFDYFYGTNCLTVIGTIHDKEDNHEDIL